MRIEDSTSDLSLKARRLRLTELAEPGAHRLSPPRNINHWAMSAAALTCLALWVAAGVHLTREPGEPTRWTLILVTIAATFTVIAGVFVTHHLLHRGMNRDHQVLLDEVTIVRGFVSELRSRVVIADAEQRQVLAEILTKLTEGNNAAWLAYAEQARRELGGDGAEVVTLGRNGRGRRPGA